MMDHNYYVTYTGFYDPDTDRSSLKDVMGRYRTNLFYEFNKARHDEYPPLYTMKESEWTGLPSAYQIFMNSESEYEAAMKLVGSWTHWNKLLKCKPFMSGSEDSGSWTGMAAWREEKEIRNKSLAFNQLKISAAQGNVPAQKLIYEGEKGQAKRGRPSKAEVTKQAAAQAERAKSVKSDLERIRHLDARTTVGS
jgi:hypothetical protein